MVDFDLLEELARVKAENEVLKETIKQLTILPLLKLPVSNNPPGFLEIHIGDVEEVGSSCEDTTPEWFPEEVAVSDPHWEFDFNKLPRY